MELCIMDQYLAYVTKVNMIFLHIGKRHHIEVIVRKKDLIRNVFVPEKNFGFLETIRSFKYE